MVICLEQGANDLHMVQLMPLSPHHIHLVQIFFTEQTLLVVWQKRQLTCKKPAPIRPGSKQYNSRKKTFRNTDTETRMWALSLIHI